jgi:hypothetical protein
MGKWWGMEVHEGLGAAESSNLKLDSSKRNRLIRLLELSVKGRSIDIMMAGR